MRNIDDDVAKRLVELGEGVTVEEDVLGIVQRIRDYDPNLVVQYCDPMRAEFQDAPFRILELCPDGMRRPVMDVWTLDERVLERLHQLDSHSHNVLEDLDRINRKASEQGKRRFREEVNAVSEMVYGVLNSPKDTYRATNPVTGEKHTFRSLPHSD